jgi:hypothetical protein
MNRQDIKYEELEELLRNWTSMAGDQTYDFVGMVHLFRACLLNLMELLLPIATMRGILGESA